MNRQRKWSLQVGGTTIVDRLLAVYRLLFDEVVLSVRHARDFIGVPVPVAVDRMAVRSSLTGIHSGLEEVRAGHAFVAACDAPFLQEGVVRLLLEAVRPDRDVIIPVREDGRMEPLCAVYSKRCLPHIHKQLRQGDCKIIRFFDKVNVHPVSLSLLREADGELLSFMNVNTPADLERARAMAGERGL